MPYSFLFSRNIQGDCPFRLVDVPISVDSLMVRAVPGNSELFRTAGWLCAIVPDGAGDYERYGSSIILYGKSRVAFPLVPRPYFLEFFPRYGRRSGVLTFYSGFPSPMPDRRVWKSDYQGSFQYALTIDGPGVSMRVNASGESTQFLVSQVTEAQLWYGYLNYREQDGSMFLRNLSNASEVYSISLQDYEDRKKLTDSIPL